MLLDREEQGNNARGKLVNGLGVDTKNVVQPQDAAGIEDVLSWEDFKNLLTACDPALVLQPRERPTHCIRRLGLDKVLLARRFAELAHSGGMALTQKTSEAVEALFDLLDTAWGKVKAAQRAGG